ncbi:hypothetical protein KHP62_06155 [Rhodobacteraceae bacterium NNCM2]|nr:hypothetical protein [Coraliihabitans acroporae]
MSTSKDKDQITEASATELDESDLDQAQGGGAYLKIPDIDGESQIKIKYEKVSDSFTYNKFPDNPKTGIRKLR